MKAIEAAQQEIELPASVRASFQGAASAFRASLANTLLLILAAVVTMYIVLGVLYESYIHPVTILSTLPSAGVGALLALMLFGQDLGIIAHHRHHPADRHRQEERDHDDRLRARRRARRRAWRRDEAIHKAALLRFRPILMTTLAALLGALPLMLGVGRRLRAAPAARHRDGRRPVFSPAADAVHHAGDLPALRSLGTPLARGETTRSAAVAADGTPSLERG